MFYQDKCGNPGLDGSDKRLNFLHEGDHNQTGRTI
jgi:hypothetical protein